MTAAWEDRGQLCGPRHLSGSSEGGDPLGTCGLMKSGKEETEAQLSNTVFGPHRAFHIGVQGQQLQHSLQELWDVQA